MNSEQPLQDDESRAAAPDFVQLSVEQALRIERNQANRRALRAELELAISKIDRDDEEIEAFIAQGFRIDVAEVSRGFRYDSDSRRVFFKPRN